MTKPVSKYLFIKCNFDKTNKLLKDIDWLTLLADELLTSELLNRSMLACADVISKTVSPKQRVSFIARYVLCLCQAKRRA
jgi:hypothetical protein